MIPASTPKIFLQLRRIMHDEHTPVSVAKRYKICLPTTTPPPFWIQQNGGNKLTLADCWRK